MAGNTKCWILAKLQSQLTLLVLVTPMEPVSMTVKWCIYHCIGQYLSVVDVFRLAFEKMLNALPL